MRTLLFVQTGDGRPKVVNVGIYDTYKTAMARVGGCWIPMKGQKAMLAADRWWLVECENAEAGRFMIDPKWTNNRCSWPPPKGRILASGGRP